MTSILAGQPDAGDLAQRRVRLLGGGRVDARAHAAPLRAPLEGRSLGLPDLVLAALADQLLDRGHRISVFCRGAAVLLPASGCALFLACSLGAVMPGRPRRSVGPVVPSFGLPLPGGRPRGRACRAPPSGPSPGESAGWVRSRRPQEPCRPQRSRRTPSARGDGPGVPQARTIEATWAAAGSVKTDRGVPAPGGTDGARDAVGAPRTADCPGSRQFPAAGADFSV